MPERRGNNRVFAQPIGRMGGRVIRTEADRALSIEDRDRLNKKAADAWIDERRARLARQSNLRDV